MTRAFRRNGRISASAGVFQVFYLVENLLILALCLEMHAEADDGTDDAAYDAGIDESLALVTALLVGLIEEPSEPGEQQRDAEEQPLVLELLGTV